MWAMEYNPKIYSLYDNTREQLPELVYDGKVNDKQLKQYGKFERKKVRTGAIKQNDALAIFLVASVLETKKKQLMKEAKGLDDVVQVSFYQSISVYSTLLCLFDADKEKLSRSWVKYLGIWMQKKH